VRKFEQLAEIIIVYLIRLGDCNTELNVCLYFVWALEVGLASIWKGTLKREWKTNRKLYRL
jgi:hypothetical protein